MTSAATAISSPTTTTSTVIAMADALELAAWDLLGGHDQFGDRCRRCGLGSVARFREALLEYRRSREALREQAP